MNTHDVLMYGHKTIQDTMGNIPTRAWEQPRVCGAWTAKDVLAHLASYEAVLVELLSSWLGDRGPTPALDRFKQFDQALNDREVEDRRRSTVTQIMDEFNTAHAQALDMIKRIPAERLPLNRTLPWYGDRYSLNDFLVYTFYGHKREHAAQFAILLDREMA